MTATVTVDVAGGQAGGAARFRDELYSYLARTGRSDVQVIGARRRVVPSWLVRRELSIAGRTRRVAVNSVGFAAPGGERWTLLRNALHFLTSQEEAELDPSLRTAIQRKARMVRLMASRADVLVTPSTAMAERVAATLPSVARHLVVRMHPVSPGLIPAGPRDQTILCPVLFESYKDMTERIGELAAAITEIGDRDVRLLVTADRGEVPPDLATHPRVDFVGRLSYPVLCRLWARSRAIYFPPGLESFGYPLAEARVSGHCVIARDTAQNREIAGPALRGFSLGDRNSLREATSLALSTHVRPDPAPFDPDAYFGWLLGSRS
ncbi:MAG: hypothetical protein ACRDRJ_02635 [Streptosporangiaceae bacterium]